MAANPSTDDQPQHDPQPDAPGAAMAASVIRDKVARAYQDEPAAGLELDEAEAVKHRSKHQQFMYQLSTSGKDLAAIQTEWHNYYQSLPAAEKHQVWQEFYESQAVVTGHTVPAADAQAVAAHKHGPAQRKHTTRSEKHRPDERSPAAIRTHVRQTAGGGRLTAKHHLQSLLFGLGMGLIAVIIFLFGFFNEVIIAPFIQPSRAAASTPLIISSDTVAPTDKDEVIIPKINVEIPVDYSQTTTNEAAIENALQDGVVHYPTTALPGQNGNAAYFGHSSNNIFNKGKYKFAFVLLHTLVPGDTFYLTYQGKVYVYKVVSKTIVEPSDVSVLGPVEGQTATATLITCDPPGTSLHRLIVVGQQISPDPAGNTAATTNSDVTSTPAQLPGNGPTLWGRFTGTLIGKLAIVAVLALAAIWVIRWIYRPRHRA